jgi:endonuclease I
MNNIKKLPFILLFFLSLFANSQIVINEIDVDTPSTDVLEFLELKTDSPNMALDGYVVVFYNGSNDQSYASYDLDGYSSDVNGLFLIGNAGVSPTPSFVFASNGLQNGPDAVAVFLEDASSFPNNTPITTANLIDVIVYDTNDGDDAGLLSGFGVSQQYNEGANGDKDNESIQRKSDGSYEVKTPTPGALNDGGGVSQIGITISTLAIEYNEGDVFDLTFTSSENLTSDLVINYTLVNGEFNNTDYSGNLTVTISSGSQSSSTEITLTDDAENEDIETLIVKYVNLDSEYQSINDNYGITVNDDDFATSAWGTPINPTYGIVSNTAPSDYYSSLDGKSGQALKDAITAIIANSTEVKAQTYGDVWDIMKKGDINPENNNEVWLLYSEIGRSKSLQQGAGGSVGKWNREHIYPQSRGGFSDGTSTTADGIDVYMATDETHIEHGHSDAHHIRPTDSGENSSRNNNDYGAEYNGPTGNSGSWKGDVARSAMYMALRYNVLSVVSGNPDNSTVGQLGDLENLLIWCSEDVPDDYEMNRNNVIYNWQNNRNPFIDLPELYSYVYGAKTAEVWNNSLSIAKYAENRIRHNNPVVDYMYFDDNINGVISVYDIQGKKILNRKIDSNRIDLTILKQGVYFFNIVSGNSMHQGKIIKI